MSESLTEADRLAVIQEILGPDEILPEHRVGPSLCPADVPVILGEVVVRLAVARLDVDAAKVPDALRRIYTWKDYFETLSRWGQTREEVIERICQDVRDAVRLAGR